MYDAFSGLGVNNGPFFVKKLLRPQLSTNTLITSIYIFKIPMAVSFRKILVLYRLKESKVVISSPEVWKNGQKWPFLAVFCDKK